MSKIQITKKTPEQIAAAFAAVYDEFQAREAAKKPTQADRLAPYRAEVLKLRRRGLNWRRIAVLMADPRIGEKVSAKLLASVFGGKPAVPAAVSAGVSAPVSVRVPAGVSASASNAVPAAAPARHLIIDPLTNRRVDDGASKG